MNDLHGNYIKYLRKNTLNIGHDKITVVVFETGHTTVKSHLALQRGMVDILDCGKLLLRSHLI